MGERAVGEEATEQELLAMIALLQQSIREGGLGFSATVAPTHNDGEGQPVPSRHASREELVALAGAIRDLPGTALEFLPGVGKFTDEQKQLMTDMSLAANRPLNWNLLAPSSQDPELVEAQLSAGDYAAARGATVLALTVPQTPTVRINLHSGFVFDALPGWAELFRRPVEERKQVLSDPAYRENLDKGAHSEEAPLRRRNRHRPRLREWHRDREGPGAHRCPARYGHAPRPRYGHRRGARRPQPRLTREKRIMEDLKCFDVDHEGPVAHVKLNRPDAFNSMTPDFWRELPAIIDQLDEEGAARAIVLSSTGRHFTAGMDLAVFSGIGDGPVGGSERTPRETGRLRSQARESALVFQESFNALERARMPVIAAIQGGCVGGGVDMISACDMRYCTEDAFFCIQEINIGLTADVGTLQRLPKLIPEGVAREYAYTGRRMPAARARELGLVNEVYPTQEAMLADVLEIANEIAEKSPLAIWGSKEMLNYTRDHSVQEGLNYIATWQSGMFFGQDMAEAFEAKREKRPAEFENLPRRYRLPK